MKRVLLLTLGNFSVGTGMYAFLGVLGPLARDLGVTVGEAGQLAAAFAVTFAIGAPLVVTATRAWGRRTVIVASLLGFALFNAVAALAPSFAVVLGSRVGGAAFACAFSPVAGAVATMMVTEEERGKALAAVIGGVVLAFAFGIPLGTVIGGEFGWRATFSFAAASNVVGALAILGGIPKFGASDRPPLSLAFMRNWAIVSNLILVITAFAGVFIAIAYIGPLIAAITKLEETGIGAVQISVGVGGAVGTLLGGYLADRRPTTGVLAALFCLSAFGIVQFSGLMEFLDAGTTLSIVGVTIALFIGSTAVFGLVPILQYRVIREALDERETALAFYYASFFFGQGLGAALGGLVIETTSLARLGFASATVLVFGAVFALFFAKK